MSRDTHERGPLAPRADDAHLQSLLAQALEAMHAGEYLRVSSIAQAAASEAGRLHRAARFQVGTAGGEQRRLTL